MFIIIIIIIIICSQTAGFGKPVSSQTTLGSNLGLGSTFGHQTGITCSFYGSYLQNNLTKFTFESREVIGISSHYGYVYCSM